MADWFVVNVADSPALRHDVAGAFVPFESREDRFPDFGINIHVLEPGEPNAKYHRESVQEDFLVLHGECLAIVEGEERTLKAWDLLHCPAGTAHVLVGAGDGPCAILMVGARTEGATVEYPLDELAARHGAVAPKATTEPSEAYSDWSSHFEPTRLEWPPHPRG